MIKRICFIAVLGLLIAPGYCQTTAEWQSDLRQLQQTVHNKYPNLFYNVTAAEWDKAVDEFNSKIPQLGKEQVLAGFVKLVAMFHVGHTQVNTFGFHHGGGSLQLSRLPFQPYVFSDGVYILKAESKYAQAVGGKITRIGKMKIDEAMEAVRPLVSYENEQGFKSNAVFFLAVPEFLKTQGVVDNADEVSVSYIKDGKESTVMLKAGNNNNIFSNTGLEVPAGWTAAKKEDNVPLWQKEPSAYRYMEYLPATKTLYVRHSVTLNDGEKTIADFFQGMADYIEKNDVQKLILDIRMNGGGNNYLNKPVITSIISSKKINQKGKFFCIIGRRTFSAAQNLTNELEKYTEVSFVGEPTSENVNFYGDTRTETLPASKLPVSLSWLWWQNLDPRDKRKATSPALAVDMSFNDYYNNLDPAINVINQYENQGDITAKLQGMVEKGKFDEAVAAAKEYLQDPLHRYFVNELEGKINAYGYSLMNKNKFEEASQVLKMNVQLFPESANACDSYAESLLNMGKKDEALKYYEIAIAKDKEGTTASNSKAMIEKIRNMK